MPHNQTSESAIRIESAVIDANARTIGKVVDIVYDEARGAPDFLVVDPGLFRARRCVPLDGSHTTENGDVVVPVAKWWVMCSPKVAKGQVISKKARARQADYYDAVDSWSNGTVALFDRAAR